jgi:L-amino acid N-acyltransferase YncA
MFAAVEVRRARAADAAAITAIYADEVLTGTATFDVEPPEKQVMAARLRELVDRGFPYLVAQEGKRVLGYAYAAPYRERAAYRSTVEDSIYLAPEARGQGIGGRLLRGLIDECTARDFRQMIAVIGDSRNLASIRLHRAAGFLPAGTLKDVGFKFGTWLDAVLMQLALGPGAGEKPAWG